MQNIVQSVYYSSDALVKKPHFHDCHQIILILKGAVEISVNGTPFHAKSGDIALFSRSENHSLSVQSAEYERYVLHIDPAVINRQSAVYSLLTDRPAGFCNVIDVSSDLEEIVGIFQRLMLEHNANHRLADEMEQLTVKQLLIKVYRCAALPLADLNDDIVVNIKRQFENAYSEPYTLDRLAKAYNVSISSLSHRFRAKTGVSVMGYLQSCRIAHAKRMLVETNMSIERIVDACGFSDNSNFSRTFRQLNDISPTEFRKKYKAE